MECTLLHCYHGLVLLLFVRICSKYFPTVAIDKTIRNTFCRCKLIYASGGKWKSEKQSGMGDDKSILAESYKIYESESNDDRKENKI